MHVHFQAHIASQIWALQASYSTDLLQACDAIKAESTQQSKEQLQQLVAELTAASTKQSQNLLSSCYRKLDSERMHLTAQHEKLWEDLVAKQVKDMADMAREKGKHMSAAAASCIDEKPG